MVINSHIWINGATLALDWNLVSVHQTNVNPIITSI